MGRKHISKNRRNMAAYEEETNEYSRNKKKGKHGHGKPEFRKTSAMPFGSQNRLSRLDVQPMSLGQEDLIESIRKNTVTLVSGCAGTGKSYLAAYQAVKALANGDVDSIVITRAMTTVGLPIGYLPGTEIEKLMPYIAPILEYLYEFLGKEEVGKLIKADIVRIIPVALLRGYTFKNAFILLDESQNLTPHEFKTILTRIGEGSKLVSLGDLDQSDIDKKGFISGLEDFSERLYKYTLKNPDADLDIDFVELTEEDIQRSEMVRQVLEVYNTDN